MKGGKEVAFLLILVLSVSFISAGFFSDIWNKMTGKVMIQDGGSSSNSGIPSSYSCSESDKTVTIIENLDLGNGQISESIDVFTDSCSGSYLTKYSCASSTSASPDSYTVDCTLGCNLGACIESNTGCQGSPSQLPPTTGVCRVTSGFYQSCVDGQYVNDYTIMPNYQSTETLCDQQDNDCDGLTDEPTGCPTRLCVGSAPLADNQKGVCLNQKKICGEKDVWVEPDYRTAVGGTYESPEIWKCGDGKDNDCDGTVDENCATLSSGSPSGGQTSAGGSDGALYSDNYQYYCTTDKPEIIKKRIAGQKTYEGTAILDKSILACIAEDTAPTLNTETPEATAPSCVPSGQADSCSYFTSKCCGESYSCKPDGGNIAYGSCQSCTEGSWCDGTSANQCCGEGVRCVSGTCQKCIGSELTDSCSYVAGTLPCCDPGASCKPDGGNIAYGSCQSCTEGSWCDGTSANQCCNGLKCIEGECSSCKAKGSYCNAGECCNGLNCVGHKCINLKWWEN
jgi:hypothetical protein